MKKVLYKRILLQCIPFYFGIKCLRAVFLSIIHLCSVQLALFCRISATACLQKLCVTFLQVLLKCCIYSSFICCPVAPDVDCYISVIFSFLWPKYGSVPFVFAPAPKHDININTHHQLLLEDILTEKV